MNQPHTPTAFTQIGLFERVRTTDVRRARRLAAATAAFFVALFIIPGRLGIRWNASPSLPVGFYIESEKSSGLVEFCPSGSVGGFAAIRGYRSEGNCPDGATPLMKPVVARSGDIVDVSSDGIAVNNRLVPNTSPRC